MFFNKKRNGTSDLEEKDEDKGSSTGAKKNMATKQTSEPPKDSNKQDDKKDLAVSPPKSQISHYNTQDFR